MNRSPLFFIGSLPFLEVDTALEFVKRYSSHFPFLPQLPEANPYEDMIGQVLRGFQIGTWDKKASICLSKFVREFVESQRIKIQIAGPLTVSRSMSVSPDEILGAWEELCCNLTSRLIKELSCEEIWVQVDEPLWSRNVPIPKLVWESLEKVKQRAAPVKVGVHSCATERPQIPDAALPIVDFYSFDYCRQPLDREEALFLNSNVLGKGKTLVLGIIEQNRTLPKWEVLAPLEKTSHLWISAGCGLAGWTTKEINHTFQNFCKTLDTLQ